MKDVFEVPPTVEQVSYLRHLGYDASKAIRDYFSQLGAYVLLRGYAFFVETDSIVHSYYPNRLFSVRWKNERNVGCLGDSGTKILAILR